jgi:hypothetical protein
MVRTERDFKNLNDKTAMKLQVGKIYCRRDGKMTAPLIAAPNLATAFTDPHWQVSYHENGMWIGRTNCLSEETEMDLVEEVVGLVPTYKPPVTTSAAIHKTIGVFSGGMGKLFGWLGPSRATIDANNEKMRREREVMKIRRAEEELFERDRIIADMEASTKRGRRLGDEYRVRVLARSLGAGVYFCKAYEVGWYNSKPASISVSLPKGKAWKRFMEPSGVDSYDHLYRRGVSSISIVAGGGTTLNTAWGIALRIMEAGVVDLPHPTIQIEAGKRYLVKSGRITSPLVQNTKSSHEYPFYDEIHDDRYTHNGESFIGMLEGRSDQSMDIIALAEEVKP